MLEWGKLWKLLELGERLERLLQTVTPPEVAFQKDCSAADVSRGHSGSGGVLRARSFGLAFLYAIPRSAPRSRPTPHSPQPP